MTPQELRASILQQAIQGKLVEQLPTDGNANDLLRNTYVFYTYYFMQFKESLCNTYH